MTHKCAECGASTVIPFGDWNTIQAPAIAAWDDQHSAEAHGGQPIVASTDMVLD
ncbi:hypothetical protein J2853_000384 [Streptosporangium lutulentum]|uniref:Uncharacterized protein n=1 Tax=Streptosporangium lutulentum TaxID=1461250 RepID=A0ABT9Q4A2_9ACTN|nr:hypothetical protein [Streptosporangium lutulentum]